MFTPEWQNEADGERAYEAHNANGARDRAAATGSSSGNRATVGNRSATRSGSRSRATPFPHVNTTDEFRAMVGLERP